MEAGGRLNGWAGTEWSNSSLPLLPVEAMRELPSFNAWLFYRSESRKRIAAQPAFTIDVFADAAR